MGFDSPTTHSLSNFKISKEFDQTMNTNNISTIATFIAIWSSKNPNTLSWLGNSPQSVEAEEPVLNDEYECDDNGC